MVLDDTYSVVFRYCGYAICTLKAAVPSEGDELGYRINDEKFKDMVFPSIGSAMAEINRTCREYR